MQTPPVNAPASAATLSAASPSAVSPSASVTAAAFADIIEPWDPGHPARSETRPRADCGTQASTVTIEQCYEAKAENADAKIDAVQQGRYAAASPSARMAILTHRPCLAGRPGAGVRGQPFRPGAPSTGSTLSACLLDESTARLDAVEGIVPAGGNAQVHRQHRPGRPVLVYDPGGLPHR